MLDYKRIILLQENKTILKGFSNPRKTNPFSYGKSFIFSSYQSLKNFTDNPRILRAFFCNSHQPEKKIINSIFFRRMKSFFSISFNTFKARVWNCPDFDGLPGLFEIYPDFRIFLHFQRENLIQQKI